MTEITILPHPTNPGSALLARCGNYRGVMRTYLYNASGHIKIMRDGKEIAHSVIERFCEDGFRKEMMRVIAEDSAHH